MKLKRKKKQVVKTTIKRIRIKFDTQSLTTHFGLLRELGMEIEVRREKRKENKEKKNGLPESNQTSIIDTRRTWR
jgi:hypothetical protein